MSPKADGAKTTLREAVRAIQSPGRLEDVSALVAEARDDASVRYSIMADAFRLAYARLSPEDRQAVLTEAIEQICTNYPDVVHDEEMTTEE